MKSSIKWIKTLLISFIVILLLVGCFMVVVDPYFHYHKPLSSLAYTLDNARYQNNGIVRHFDYDAIITGSSMTECFKTSELDALFGTSSVKVPYSGGSYKEVNDNLKVAVKSQPNLKMVVRGLDPNRFFNGKDDVDYDSYPTYLYDDNPFNDVGYLYNIDIILKARQTVVGYFKSKKNELSFDEYCNWSAYYNFSETTVRNYYKRDTIVPAEEMLPITAEDYAKIDANIAQNVTDLVAANPDIQFYIYFTPYSIFYMDYWKQLGELERQLLAERHIIELLIQYDNLHLYSFYTDHEVINNLNNYRDVAHHSGAINSQILVWISENHGLITKDNYQEYCDYVYDYYMNFDYDSLFE